MRIFNLKKSGAGSIAQWGSTCLFIREALGSIPTQKEEKKDPKSPVPIKSFLNLKNPSWMLYS
jgi:hypothetical protein